LGSFVIAGSSRSISARVNLGFLEGLAHRLLDPCRLLFRDLFLDEAARHLVEDPGAPERCEEFELGEAEQRVAEREGVEDVGVEDGAEGHGGARLSTPGGG
jgi:hypothetical protein